MARATYRPGEVAELLGVSVDTVRRWCDSGKLPTRRTQGGQRLIDGRALARFLDAEGLPPDQAGSSARNRITGVVTSVLKDRVMAQVELRAGPFRIVSLMSREAADELGLVPGVRATAVIKATNVAVEVVP